MPFSYVDQANKTETEPISYQPVHSIFGRIRLRLKSLHFLEDGLAKALEVFLRDHLGIQDVRLNRSCRCLVVTYDPGVLKEDDLLGLLRRISLNTLRCYRPKPSCSHAEEPNESSWLPLLFSSAAIALSTLSGSSLFAHC